MSSAPGAPVWSQPTLVPIGFQSGGTLALDALYVERRADSQLFDAMRQGNLCHVLAPHQLGKSSLLLRTKDHLQRQGWLCIDLDLKIFATDAEHQFYGAVMDRLARELGLYWDAAKFRQRHLESPLNYLWVSFLIDHLLPARRQNLAIFVDDTDVLTRRAFGASDFLLGCRTAIERSAQMAPTASGQRALFSICLAGVVQPGELLKDSRNSLTDISRAIELGDFTSEESRQLLPALQRQALYGGPLLWLEAIVEWTGGHPYLTQKLCAGLAETVPAPPSNFRPQLDVARKLVRKEVADRVNRLFLFNRESYVQAIKDELESQRGSKAHRELMSLYRRVYVSGPGRQVEWNPGDPVQQALLLSGLVKKQVQDENATAPAATLLVVRNNVFRELFGPAWLARQEHPALASFSDKMIAFFQSKKAYRHTLTYREVQSLIEASNNHNLTLGRDYTSYLAQSEQRRRKRRINRNLSLLLLMLCALGAVGFVYRKTIQKRLLGQQRENLEKEVKALENDLGVLAAKSAELEEQVVAQNATMGTFATEERTLNDQIEQQKQRIKVLRDGVVTLDKLALSAKKFSRDTMKVLRQKLNETADALQQRNAVLGQRIDELRLRGAGLQAAQKKRLEELVARDHDTEATLKELVGKRGALAPGVLTVLGRAARSFDEVAAGRPRPVDESARELRLALDGPSPMSMYLPFVERNGLDGDRVALCAQSTADSGVFVSLDGTQLHLWTAATLETPAKKPLLLGEGGTAQYAAALAACSRGVLASANGKLAAWDGRSVRPIKTGVGATKLLALAPLAEGEPPDGVPLLSGGGDPKLSRFLYKDLAIKSAGEPLVHDSAVSRAVISRDGAWVLSAAERRLYLWDFGGGKTTTSRDIGHDAAVTALALSSYDEGTTVLSGSGQGEIKKWVRNRDALTLRRAMNVHQGAVLDLVLAEGGRYIISAGSDGYIIWTDPRDGKQLYKMGPFDKLPRRLAISADSTRLFVGFPDKVRMYYIGDRDFLRLACQVLQGRPGILPEQLHTTCDRYSGPGH